MSSFKTIIFAILALLPIAANANSPLEPKLAPALNCEAKLLTEQEQEALAESIAQQENQILKEENELANKQKELSEEKAKVAQSKLTLEANQAQNTSAYRGKTKLVLETKPQVKTEIKEKGPSLLSRAKTKVAQTTKNALKKMVKPAIYSTAFSAVLGLGYFSYHYAIDVPNHFEKVNGTWIKQVEANDLLKAAEKLSELDQKIQSGELSLTPDELLEKTNQELSMLKDSVYIDGVSDKFGKNQILNIAETLQNLIDNYALSKNLRSFEAQELGTKVFKILRDDFYRLTYAHYNEDCYLQTKDNPIPNYNPSKVLKEEQTLVYNSYQALDPILNEMQVQKMNFSTFRLNATHVLSEMQKITLISQYYQDVFLGKKLYPVIDAYLFSNKEALTHAEMVDLLKLFKDAPHKALPSVKSYLLFHTELSSIEATEIINLYVTNGTERAKLYEEFITRQLEKKKVDLLPKKED